MVIGTADADARRRMLDDSGSSARFSYDALNPDKKRKGVSRTIYREDHHTRGNKGRGLQANAHDLYRNLSLFGWMVRRHLDYVAKFQFYSRTGDEDLDAQIERLMKEDAIPSRIDVARRFGREKMFRLAELGRTLAGDVYLVKLARMRLQGIGGDLVRDPSDMAAGEDWINGHLINDVGATRAVSVWNRGPSYSGTASKSRRVSAQNIMHYGYFDRFAGDQTRGVSPVVSALNPLRDVYENFDFALAKSKIGQLFALQIMREGNNSSLELGPSANTAETDDQNSDHVDDNDRGFEAFLKSDLRFLDLKPSEKAEIIESKTPPQELQTFTQLVIQCGITALDIPYNFFDSSHSNFFGSRASWHQYERSTLDKRDDQVELRRQYTLWKLRGWIIDGRLELPRGITIADLMFEWVAQGVPWWKPVEEVKGANLAIASGLDNPQRVCMATGTDFRDNINKRAAAEKYASERGVTVTWESAPEPQTVQVVNDDDDN